MQDFADNAYYLSIFNPEWDDAFEFFANIAVLDAAAGEAVLVSAMLDAALADLLAA
jgi:hypothetical protein